MNRSITLGLAMFAGAALGAAAVQVLHAQAKPAAYVIYEHASTNQDAYAKEFTPLAQKSVRDYGGKFLRGGGALQGAKSLSVSGEPPKNIVLFQFESLDKAQAWGNSSAWKDLAPIGQKYSSYFRVYAVEGLPQ
jgi:uncharacterized protein (DUF1330 family)